MQGPAPSRIESISPADCEKLEVIGRIVQGFTAACSDLSRSSTENSYVAGDAAKMANEVLAEHKILILATLKKTWSESC